MRTKLRRDERTGRLLGLAVLVSLGLAIGVQGCSSSGRPKRPERAPIVRDLPVVLRGTVGSEVTIRGLEPVVVSGYGLVVGLDGTGSGDVPQSIRATLEAEMRRMGVGTELSGRLKDITPGQLIDDPNTAVVLVQAMAPPGAPVGTKFDVRVSALPGSATSSLSGGTLWTTDLRPGLANPTGPDVLPIARARGPIFLNPFADANSSDVTPDEVVGRVLDGGEMSNPRSITVQLDNPSHSRAREIVRALNTAFPRQGREAVARGLNDEAIELTVPARWRARPEEFLKLVNFTRIDQAFKEDWAQRYAQSMVQQPELSEDLSWCLRALGPVAIPFVRPLYDHPELRPRMTAIEVGGYLGDALAREPLEGVVASGAPAERADAIRLMARLPVDGRVNRYLRQMLDSEDVELRIAAYEALEELNDPTVRRRQLAGKFELHQAPSAHPLIYVTQQHTPRIVVLGDDVELSRPLFVRGWDGRLMMNASSSAEPVRTMYRDPITGRAQEADVAPALDRVIELFAHESTPEHPAPGFDMTYSQVVGALCAIVEAGGIDAQFLPESDRLSLAIVRGMAQAEVEDRPELSGDGAVDRVEVPAIAEREAPSTTESGTQAGYVVPLQTATPKLKSDNPK
ncbi:MAG: flagellar basal body P-ring protein FlgI [Phycisphaerales bacterium]|nr:flagellar basal body P-ring protein FlgI [Phycisphaerales bacterium]